MSRKAALLPTLFVAVLFLAGCTILPSARPRAGVQKDATPTPIPTPIVPNKPTYKVQRGTVVRMLQFTGRIAPIKEKDLFFRMTGRVHNVLVKAQDLVKAGQLLSDLENDNIQRDLTSGKLDLSRAQSLLEQAKIVQQDNIKRAQVQRDIASQALAISQGQDPTPRKTQAEVALRLAQIEVAHAQTAYDGIAWRPDKGLLPESAALEQATLNAKTAQANYDLALQSLTTHAHEVVIAQEQVQLAQLALDTLQRGVDPMLQNDVERADLNVKKLEAALADSQLIAPFDGLVTSIGVYEGRAADAYSPVLTVSDPTSLEIRVDSTSTPTTDLAEGQAAVVTLVGKPGVALAAKIRQLPYSGGVTAAGQDVDKSIHLSFVGDTSSAGFQLGDLARVAVTLEQKDNALWLPPAAVRTFEGRKFVVVQDGSVQTRVDVKLGIEGDDRSEILDGLTEGQTVLGQ
jgi:multidrug efflux pump subunit AcrA (membrane-fusion protein)